MNLPKFMDLSIGLESIENFKRLNYSEWYALAEFVDNSTQSFIDNEDTLRSLVSSDAIPLEVSINYDNKNRSLIVKDNAMGMSESELAHAMNIGRLLPTSHSRGRYGMGLKTAACWFGERWSVTTKKYGSTHEYTVSVDVGKISRTSGHSTDLPVQSRVVAPELHYTHVEIFDLRRSLSPRIQRRIKVHLASIYRQDFRNNRMSLLWGNESIRFDELESNIERTPEGLTKKDISFNIGRGRSKKSVRGWVAVLSRGSREYAGFAVIHNDRVLIGQPNAWRPEMLFGDARNDLANQRLFGELFMDDFEVSQTKDNILWLGDEQTLVDEMLYEECKDYQAIANQRDKTSNGPNSSMVNTALNKLKRHLMTDEFAFEINSGKLISDKLANDAFEKFMKSVLRREPNPNMLAKIGDELTVIVYLVDDASANDPYYALKLSKDKIIVAINREHVEWENQGSTDAVYQYIRECVYDGLAEYGAGKRSSEIKPNTIKYFKDKYFRVSYELT